MNRPVTNRGWFRLGEDPRRHALTTEERRRGHARAVADLVAKLAMEFRFPIPLRILRATAREMLKQTTASRTSD